MKKIILPTFLIIMISGCSYKAENLNTKKEYSKNKRWYLTKDKSFLKKIGRYKVRGDYYQPFIPKIGYKERGVASWYGIPFHGRKTASGEIYNMNRLSAAHKKLAINTIVKVTNVKNKKFVIVRINDRGPYKYDREIDLSMAAAKRIGIYEPGTGIVQIDVLGYGEKK